MEESINQKATMLGHLRVLDITSEKGLFCGKFLADLGAEVIKVERPGGDPSRLCEPFLGKEPDPNQSLFWLAVNASKKSITLNLKTTAGQELLRGLARKADFVIESYAPGKLDSWGIGYKALNKVNRKLIFTSITPFGQDGPYRDYLTSDLVSMALGGYLYLSGQPDRPPVRISFPQSYAISGAEAATASLIAYHYRRLSGQGQWVDVSIQQAVAVQVSHAIPTFQLRGVVLKRTGALRSGLGKGLTSRNVWPCRDGYVCYMLMAGLHHAKSNKSMVKWLESEGMADEFLRDFDWVTFDMSKVPQSLINRIEVQFGKFFLKHTKIELQEGGLERRIDVYPVFDTKNIAESRQLKARDFWQKVEYSDLGRSIMHPGPFAKASATPLRVPTRAPLVGEHNQEIYTQWLGLSRRDINAHVKAGII